MAVWIPYLELNCDKCSDSQKQFNGCEQDSIIPDRWEIGKWKFNRCPKKLITYETQAFVRAYNLMQIGVMPYNLGWLGQSNKFVEAMIIIDGELKMLESKTRLDLKNKMRK